MDIHFLVKITARAWALDILALLHDGVPGRQAPLLRATGAGRTAFAQSLAHLTDLGLLRRNPGHGHPLRPEYILTPAGTEAAAMAARIKQIALRSDEARLIRRNWTVPVLAISRQPRYFSEIKGRLGRITDRALSRSLHDLQSRRWIERVVDDAAYPPRPIYRAANTGANIGAAVGLKL